MLLGFKTQLCAVYSCRTRQSTIMVPIVHQVSTLVSGIILNDYNQLIVNNLTITGYQHLFLEKQAAINSL